MNIITRIRAHLSAPITLALFCAMLAVGATGLAGCSAVQIGKAQTSADNLINKVQADAAKITPELTNACATATTMAPLASAVSPVGAAIAGYVVSGCGDAEKVAAIAGNPTSAAWVEGLIAQMNTLVPKTSVAQPAPVTTTPATAS